MARKALGPAALSVVQAVGAAVDGPMLVAFSGGADSTALALGAGVVGGRRGWPVRAVVVDHGLQAGSSAVAREAAARLEAFSIPVEVVGVRVDETGEGVEAAARHARYAALLASASGGEAILLGHTLDDQAETVLLGLARGSGLRSLAGMRPRRGSFVRPLLGVRADTTRQACREWGVAWWDDPHNDEDRFTRVRVRRRVLPVLEAELGPGVADALARTAELAAADADYLDGLAADALTAQDADLGCAWLAGLAPALRTRVLRDWLRAHGVDELSATHVGAVEALVVNWHGQRGVQVPGATVTRRDGRLTVATASTTRRPVTRPASTATDSAASRRPVG